ncbi:MAG: CoA transferase [Bryobacteraceae bacterium]|nr:CoA transferase [Bryobacteraceae bacterium]
MHAVGATLLALRLRRRTGQGAHVDQAMRDTGLWMLTHTYQFWDMMGINLTRHGAQRDVGGAVRLPHVYRCKDGYVVWMFQTGQRGKTTRTLVEWMAEQGAAVSEVSVPLIEHAPAIWATIIAAEAYSIHEASLRDRAEEYGDDVRARLRWSECLLDSHYLKAAKLATLFWGGYAVLTAEFGASLGALIEAVNMVGSFFYGGMLGVFILAFYFPRVTANAAFAGVLLGEAAILLTWRLTGVSFLWYNVIGCAVVVAAGVLLSRRQRI